MRSTICRIIDRKVFAIALTLLLLGTGGAVYALESHVIFTGTWDDITEHGICRRVSNPSGPQTWTPTLYAQEWGSFIGDPPPNISIGPCPSGNPGGAPDGRRCGCYQPDGGVNFLACNTTISDGFVYISGTYTCTYRCWCSFDCDNAGC